MIELQVTSHHSTPGESRTIARIQQGSYKEPKITLTRAPRGTRLMVAPMGKVVLKLAGIEDCILCPPDKRIEQYQHDGLRMLCRTWK